MRRKKLRNISIGVGLLAGACADGYLRLISGDEGNLLVHSAVFLGVAVMAAGLVYVSVSLLNKKK